DWGLAKVIGRPEQETQASEATLRPSSGSSVPDTQAGSVVGTPSFMSPEAAAGRWDSIGPASDVYSLGATLYALLTGKAPFNGENMGSLLAKVRLGDFPPPRRLNSAISR